MLHALGLGRRGMGRCWPNPAVGCVIVRKNRIVGRGWTAPGGRPHAEPQALAMAKSAAEDATVYVTLEPCAHTGKTPPCASALIKARVARVVIAAGDPDPRVAGRGIAMLRDAGIDVTTGVCEDQANWDQAGFFLRVLKNRPWVTLKLASSFDGRIATATGESQWITGPAARHHVHADRLRHDAVMVGAGTARADDPSLTVRGFGAVRQPVRVVVSSSLDLPRKSTLAKTAKQIPVWLVHGPASIDAASYWDGIGAKRLPVEATSPAKVLQALARAGLTRVYCEGGGQLAASLLQNGLVDELVGYTAGLALGSNGRPTLGALNIPELAKAARFNLVETRPIGADVLHRWRRSDYPA
jgi:diaminohydroxyphosphoribosylaminopyrimidine deaminase/5-amino-6-(5-phosphoribosylamino)uracil reductase